MKKPLLAAVLLASLAPAALAQTTYSNLSLIDGARFNITGPASLQGGRNFTFAGASGWGGTLATPIINTEIVQAFGTANSNKDSLMCSPIANGTAINNKVAIFYRGTCNFSAKAYEVQLGGAKAAIIINNVPGAPVGMASGTNGSSVTIPVFMISDVDGAALLASVRAQQKPSVTMTQWNSGYTYDIGLIPRSSAVYHAGAIPRKQLAASNGDPAMYRMYSGAIVANFGSQAASNMVLTNRVSWTPTGGATTQVYSDTARLASLPVLDSTDLIFNPRFYNPHTTTNGRYTVNTSVTSPNTDPDTIDNKNSYSVYVTDDVYSKTLWDTLNMRPSYTSGNRLQSQGALTWGPLFYVAAGGDYPAALQFTLATEAAADLNGDAVTTAIFKFNDGANGNPVDGIFQDGELSLKALGYKTFGPADTATFNSYTVSFDGSLTGTRIAPLDNGGVYWTAVNPSNGQIYIGNNDAENSYMRSFVSKRATGAKTEYIAPTYVGEASTIPNGLTGTVSMIPFQPTNAIDSVWIDLAGYTPAIGMRVTPNPVAVKNVSNVFKAMDIFPNPAQTDLHVRWEAPASFGLATITVYNGVGQPVSTTKTYDLKGDLTISLASQPAGNYWVVFATEKGIESRALKIVR